ncbi:hypothetical protein [Alloprevotella tannerae]|uniref:Uncharacterized protein n=1 Tax=Alloprevotella tannerae ATCC 51259 TaxID=626522 RepID=C9LKR1_9BACT|nr:hypothetical protein [Alloprevotella tannerae]EEX70289.1 hypothetical protein GCWU000325_02831 [Alloprevotella tannerae ATCC 51259]
MAADLFFLASSPAFIDDEALVHAPRLVLFACWRIFLFLLCFVVLFAAAKLSFAAAKPLFAPTKRKPFAVGNRKSGYKTMKYAMPDCSLPLSPCCIL